jgi:hypothetical protein
LNPSTLDRFITVAVEAAMATFRLRVRPGTGVDISDPNANPVDVPGATFGFVDRLLEDRHGNLRGTLTFRGMITKNLAANDLEVAFDATNKLDKGVINTQGVIRFNDLTLPNGVTFAIVGGTRKYKKARGTVTGKFVAPDVFFTFRVK